MNRYLLGFDLRSSADEYLTREWTTERRQRYLLQPETPWPVSVDAAVWPSLFSYSNRLNNYLPVQTIHLEPSKESQSVLRLWDDAPTMISFFIERFPRRRAVAIEIQLWHDGPAPLLVQRRIEVTSEWMHLGFDVADQDLTSGLMNCGLGEAKHRDLRTWSNHLNRYGLFDDITKAQTFARALDSKIPDHAPFFAYQILANPRDMSWHKS